MRVVLKNDALKQAHRQQAQSPDDQQHDRQAPPQRRRLRMRQRADAADQRHDDQGEHGHLQQLDVAVRHHVEDRRLLSEEEPRQHSEDETEQDAA
jgi:hypothetical protein